MKIVSPVPYRVFQQGVPSAIRFTSDSEVKYCNIKIENKEGQTVFEKHAVKTVYKNGQYIAYVHIPAGGWYKLTVSTADESDTAEPFGCGEVFVIAGQSHATNSLNKQFNIREKEGRITVYEPSTDIWRTAHDRQPCYDSSDYNARFGSLWPVTFDNLFDEIQVPIGLTNAAYGATALFQWTPGHEMKNFDHLVTCCQAAENFRAILWQQGESDVMWHTETMPYYYGMVALRNNLDRVLGFDTKWLVAKSTIHPSVYNDPEHEKLIRDADDLLWKTEGFYPGPDTDTVNGDCRDLGEISGHMTEKGQLKAGRMWADVLINFLRYNR